MKDIIVAIDGSSGCGKSTTAKMVAKELGYSYIDTGAMYRATTLYFIRNYVRLTNEKDVESALKHITIEFVFNKKFECTETYLNGLRVEKEITHIICIFFKDSNLICKINSKRATNKTKNVFISG